jgi:hypothetical protein
MRLCRLVGVMSAVLVQAGCAGSVLLVVPRAVKPKF